MAPAASSPWPLLSFLPILVHSLSCALSGRTSFDLPQSLAGSALLPLPPPSTLLKHTLLVALAEIQGLRREGSAPSIELAPLGVAGPVWIARVLVSCPVQVPGWKLLDAAVGAVQICPHHASIPELVLDGRRVRFCQLCRRFEGLEEFEGDR